ncbi:MAG: DcaP family trimeric outer membrane transporter [Halioglobus sp.]
MSTDSKVIAVLLVWSLAVVPSYGQSSDSLTQPVADAEESMQLKDVLALLRQQQQELASQKQLLEAQSRKIESLTRELDGLRTTRTAAQQETAQLATQVLDSPAPTPAAQAAVNPPEPQTEQELDTAVGQAVTEAQVDDPSRNLLEDFSGAWLLPGTQAALAIGGFVKTDVVYNFDPLQIADRFIVGSIPVGVQETTGDEAQSSITADQSRLNFDLREATDYGVMRAFIEGDFAGSNETFRLRHAFGQWRRMLAGKTWSTFVDPEASPEEIDFEGLNARINVRQSQLRYMPKLGEEYELQFAMEDPNPEIQNGTGVTRNPDLVLAGRFSPRERLHMKLSLLLREIRGQSLDGDVEKKYAWGTSISGRYMTPRFDARDSVLFQLNYGKAIGRYVNDLSSIGNYDGIFNLDTGELELFTVTAGYVSLQHWWSTPQLRSNFTFGAVDVDNPGFLGGDAYRSTLRFSTNLMWSPIPSIDLGGEYLWGRRENQNGAQGDATQFQFAVRYLF